MELEDWIDHQDIDALEEMFMDLHKTAGYIIEDKESFIEAHESDFADFLWAKYNDDEQGRIDQLIDEAKDRAMGL